MAGNANLGAARAAKNDEFYTQWDDIENEMQAYLEYDPDVFRGKVVLLPCDDPEASNFTKYFALNFNKLGLKKLISTSYDPCRKGRIYVTGQGANLNDGSNLNKEYLKWDYLEGDGDFRSEEVTALRDEADMVITNPPFSLFREFVGWLEEGHVQYSVISNQNAVTYKEIFPLIKDDRMWYGKGFPSAVGFFKSPYKDTAVAADRKEGFIRVSGVIWLTNIEHGRRHEPLPLMAMDDSLRYNKRIMGSLNSYKNYDNYDAIEVPFTSGIPSDHEGVMGVPISFLDKYSPEQFEIVGISEQNLKGGSGDLWDQASGVKHPLIADDRTYARIFIRHRNPERKESQLSSRPWGGRSSLRCKRELSHVEVRG